MKGDNEPAAVVDQSVRSRRLKFHEASSKYLSWSTPTPDIALQQKPTTSTRKNNNRILEEPAGLIRGLWPSSITSTPSSPLIQPSYNSNNKKNQGTLADHLQNERLKDLLEGRQENGVDRLENLDDRVGRTKENQKPSGGSLRYTRKFLFPGRSSLSLSSSSSSTSSSSFSSSTKTPSSNSGSANGRRSVDENILYGNLQKNHSEVDDFELEGERDDTAHETMINSPAATPHKSSTSDIQRRLRRGTSDSNIQPPDLALSTDVSSSPKVKKSTTKSSIKRANSLTLYGSTSSRWALSPGRTGSPPMSVESKEKPMSFSSMKLSSPSSPSRPNKGGHVEKFFNLGLDLFKSSKSSSPASVVLGGPGNVESLHMIRLMHNRMMQWRFANARAGCANANTDKQMESNMLTAWDTLTNLQHSVMLKKLQLQREKLKLKLDCILQSQIKYLEEWAHMERQHLSAVSTTTDCMHSVVCKLPLTEGAKVDPQSTSVALRHALYLMTFFKTKMASFSPSVEENVELLSQIAQTVAQEKLLLDECHEHLQKIQSLQVQERSLECSWMQLVYQRQNLHVAINAK